jgi:SAM-dependent methyltransferase
LYVDKNYADEVSYVLDLIKKHEAIETKNILELGSGTGKHAKLFTEKGYSVTGIERSAEMAEIANADKNSLCNFIIADITQFHLNQTFGIAVSLFHVISYLTKNEDLIRCFQNVNQHLAVGGLFIFDVWHSSAVHHQIPQHRVKILRDENVEVKRTASPQIFPELNIVEVNYDIRVEALATGEEINFKENHPMRHFSKPEIEILAYTSGFELIKSEEFLTKNEPSVGTWGVCYILKKKKKNK